MKTWAQQLDQSENGMDRFYRVKYFDFAERFQHKAPLAEYSYSTAVYSQGEVSVTLFTSDGVAHYRTIKGDQNTASAICEAHLKLNLGYEKEERPGTAVWKPLYTGD